MNRRNFLKTAGAVTGTFMVPELIIPDKRFWALDRSMILPKPTGGWRAYLGGPTIPLIMTESPGFHVGSIVNCGSTRLRLLEQGPSKGPYMQFIAEYLGPI